MSVAVVVPFRGGCPYRERAWRWLRGAYAATHPDWTVTEAKAPPGPWIKALAVNPAVEASDAEVIVLADADVWSDGLPDAVAAVAAGAGWAAPHRLVHRLSEDGTEAVLRGEDWRGQPVAQRPYCGFLGGGVVVAPRETLVEVCLDPRFEGWGQEDESHAIALATLAGKPWRGDADLAHLFHPPQERMNRRRGSKSNWKLRERYAQAKGNRVEMQKLLDEFGGGNAV